MDSSSEARNDVSNSLDSAPVPGSGNGGISSESVDEYLADLFKADSEEAGPVANSSLEQSDMFKEFADCIIYNPMTGEQHNVYQVQEPPQISQPHTGGGEPAGVISAGQNAVLRGSEVRQRMPDVPEIPIRNEESQQNAASISRSFSSEVQVLESFSADKYAPSNNLERENIYKPVVSTFHASKFGRSSLAVSKPSGIGLHLNSIVKVLPMGCGANSKPADKDYMFVQGKKPLCTTDSHSKENAENSPTSSKAVDGLLKPSEHHSTACDQRECTKSSPQKKRKRSTGSSDGDGCKYCNCKKTKCLKQYCDCFASGYYCGETCSCQGCFNTPEYEDKVNETRRQIVSRDPFAFVPKVLQRVGESPGNNVEDIYKSTPSSARHKRGCRCKKSMCMQRYCECYQSNVGCSDGCRCAGCENAYGKKEECGSGKDIGITEANNEMPSELSIPHDMTNDTSSQPCPGGGSFPTVNSSELTSTSPITSVIPRQLTSSPITSVIPRHSRFPELRPGSSITALGPGRKYILKAASSFPPLAPSIDGKSTSSPSTNAPDSRNI